MSKLTFPSLKAATVIQMAFKGSRCEPFTVALSRNAAALDDLAVKDPSPTEWSSIGLTSLFGADFPVISPGAVTLAVQVNERMLPGKVRDEAVQKLATSISEREGRRVTKKEYRELRDEVETELLPKAFIRRSVTMVTFCDGGRTIFWASSARRFDLCLEVVRTACGLVGHPVEQVHNVFANDVNLSNALLLPIAKCETQFGCGDAAVMERTDDTLDPMLRMKDVALAEITGAIRRGYVPKALAITFGDDFSFTLNNAGVFTKIVDDSFDIGAGDKDDKVGAFNSCLFGLQSRLSAVVDDLLAELPDNSDDL